MDEGVRRIRDGERVRIEDSGVEVAGYIGSRKLEIKE